MRETERIGGTRIGEIIEGLDAIYAEIAHEQDAWKKASPFQCPDGCGSCCVDFEPDVLESEALYLAAWMLFHQRDRALSLLDGSFISPRADTPAADAPGCILFDPKTPWHCTVYEGRCLICRLFGYSGDRGKDGRPRLKPCKFLPVVKVVASGSGAGDRAASGAVEHRQYSESELLDLFGAVPPVMADIAAQVVALTPDAAQDRLPLREALRIAISKILMLERFSASAPEPETPEPNPESPVPRAS